MFPLSTVLFPHGVLPLHVFEARYRELTTRCLAGDSEFGVVLVERGSEVGGGETRAALGTIARIEDFVELPDGRFALVTRGTCRVRVTQWLPDDPFPLALVEELESVPLTDRAAFDRAFAAVRRARALLSEAGDTAALPPGLELGDDLEVAGWRLCALAPLGLADNQRLLAVDDGAERIGMLAGLAGAVADDAEMLLAAGIA